MPKLGDLFDLNLFQKHIEDRIITVRELDEPNSPLRIANYTAKAQYDNIWDDVTRQCRGLIYTVRDFEVLARPFQKFFNAGDSRHPETLEENFPPYQPFVTRKYDGSLGIGYKHNGKWRVATRGSFHSEQAEWATRWLQSQKDVSFPDGWTPLFEIVYAANKIVVDYEWEGLVLLGMVNNETGAEIVPEGLKFIAEANGMWPVESFHLTRYYPVSALLEENKPNEEGYVLAYHVGDGPPLRVKVKFEDYCRLHRLVHQTSPVAIWEMLQEGKEVHTLFTSTPKPFQTWVWETIDEIQDRKLSLTECAHSVYFHAPPCGTRREFAEFAKTKGELTPLLFALLDGKDIVPMVWKMVRPVSAQPFKQGEA